MKLDRILEAVLFWKGEPVSIKKLAEICAKNEDEVKESLKILEERLVSSGLSLINWQEEVSLTTHKDVSDIILSLKKEDLERDLGKAGLETLAIILYKPDAKKADIDYIRGVNSSLILRNLQIRGLISRKSDCYIPTTEFLAFLGIQSIDLLPDKEEFINKINQVMRDNDENKL